ncbi:unnamed protein product [Cladocopium goreaui]|uniref:Uncharacterized protein n=1 Tax=Cladocopium goreaui TaxID=2562237 RepID=A0A9P1GCJ2_9DINO|nr:unnamed protein product [Cladocopium goreaui]
MFNVKGGLVDVRALFRPPLHRRVTLVDQGNQAGKLVEFLEIVVLEFDKQHAVQHVVPVSVDDIVGPQKIDDIRCGACRSRWTDSSPDSSDGQWECRPSRGVVGISEVEGTVGDQFGIYDTEDASEAVSSAFAALLYEPRATALPWLEREYIRLQRAEVEMYKVKRAATATAEKASIGKAKQLQSPSGQEFTVVLSPEEHQEYLRRRQLPGSPQGPTSPSSPWPSLAAGASPSQGGGQASLSGLLQQMAASAAAAAATSQKRTSPTAGRPATLATPSMASTPTSFLEFVMILTPEEHADYLQRRQGDTGKSPSTSPGVTVTASPLSTPQLAASPGSSRSSRTRSQQASLAGLLQEMSVSVPT